MHCCPKSAACWSPASEAIGIGTGTCGQSVVPYTALVGTTSGSIERGMSNRSSSSSSQSRVWMSKSIVREAFETSVMWSRPPESRHASHESTVPNISLPCSARFRAPGTLSSIHLIFVALK